MSPVKALLFVRLDGPAGLIEVSEAEHFELPMGRTGDEVLLLVAYLYCLHHGVKKICRSVAEKVPGAISGI